MGNEDNNLSILNPYIFIFSSLASYCTTAPKSRAQSGRHSHTILLQDWKVIPAQEHQAGRFTAQRKKADVAEKERQTGVEVMPYPLWSTRRREAEVLKQVIRDMCLDSPVSQSWWESPKQRV